MSPREELLHELDGASDSVISELIEAAKKLKSNSLLTAAKEISVAERRATLATFGRHGLPVLSDDAMSRSTIYGIRE